MIFSFMRRLGACLLMGTLLASASAQAPEAPPPPVARKVPFVVKSPQGDRVDEYHWLRDDDPKAKRPEVMQYLEAESAYAAAKLAPLQPLQDKLVAEMRSRLKEDDSSVPAYDNGWWLWRRFQPGAEYGQWMRRRGSPEAPQADAPEELILDEPARAAGHAYYNATSTALSPSGHLLAWAEDTTGRRIYTLRVMDLRSGRLLADEVSGITGEIVWGGDDRALYYLRQDPVTLQGEAVMRLTLGGKPTEVYREKDKTLFLSIDLSASREKVLINLNGYDQTETLELAADGRPHRPRLVLARRAGIRAYADHLDGRWVIRTNEKAPNYRLVESRKPASRGSWRDIVPARADTTVEAFTLLEGAVAVQERVQGASRVRIIGRGARTIEADPAGTIALAGNRDARAAHLRFTLDSLIQPTATWDLHLASGERVLRKEQPVPGYDKTLYATERTWATARDGQRVPVTLAWRRDRAARDGKAPLYVEAYGAYGYSFDPEFSNARVSLLDRGFVYAIAHVRGGADLGEAWYEAGKLRHKKNTFNDFVDATDALVAQGWGAKDKVFASGGSAGGLLMGVVANEAGMRYRGIALHVPFVDVVTTMLDETIPLTANEWTQWGDPRKKGDYEYMLSYSPYDNIGAHDYPAMLVTTGLWDSQVQYWEPAKYVARLRERKTDNNPLLLHVNFAAGHGGASGRFERLKERAREYAFFIDLAGQRE